MSQSHDENSVPETSTPQSAPVPLRIKEKVHLAAAIGCDRKSIQRWSKLADFPKPYPDGYDVAEVQAWMTARGVQKAAKGSLRDENLRLKNAHSKFDLDVKKGEYLKKTDVRKWLGEMISAFRLSLMASAPRIGSKVATQQAGEATATLRKEFKKVLAKLSEEPWEVRPLNPDEES